MNGGVNKSTSCRGINRELRRLKAKGYYEDELMWAYERLLAQRGQAFPGASASAHRR